MAKVKASFSKPFRWENEEINLIVVLDVSDDDEGYGVVLGDDETDITIAFGQGELACALASKLFVAVANELESYPDNTEISDTVMDHHALESLFCCSKEAIMPEHEHFEELKKIINYIDKWYKVQK